MKHCMDLYVLLLHGYANLLCGVLASAYVLKQESMRQWAELCVEDLCTSVPPLGSPQFISEANLTQSTWTPVQAHILHP